MFPMRKLRSCGPAPAPTSPKNWLTLLTLPVRSLPRLHLDPVALPEQRHLPVLQEPRRARPRLRDTKKTAIVPIFIFFSGRRVGGHFLFGAETFLPLSGVNC